VHIFKLKKLREALYFLTPFRIYEFAVGAIALECEDMFSTLGKSSSARYVGMSGILGTFLVGYSIYAMDSSFIFPHWYGLVPCTGTALLILGGKFGIVGQILSSPLAGYLGSRSYSIYLVHWPLIVFFSWYAFEELRYPAMLILSLSSVALGELLYRYVETPLRCSKRSMSTDSCSVAERNYVSSNFKAYCITIIAIVTLSMCGLNIEKLASARDVKSLGPLNPAAIENRIQLTKLFRKTICRPEDIANSSRCYFDRPIQILFLGNSHEADAYYAFQLLYANHSRVNFIQYGNTNHCGFRMNDDGLFVMTGVAVHVHVCKRRVEVLNNATFVRSLTAVVHSELIRKMRNKKFIRPNAIVQAMRQFIHVNPSIVAVEIGAYAELTRSCADIMHRFGNAAECLRPAYLMTSPFDPYSNTSQLLDVSFKHVYVSKSRLFCSNSTLQSCKSEAYGEPFSYDRDHFSLGFRRFFGERLWEEYGSLLHESGFPSPLK
jgi:hypothetical protein